MYTMFQFNNEQNTLTFLVVLAFFLIILAKLLKKYRS